MKKAALELSLNFIITTILGLVIFFGIVVLNRNIFVETIDMQQTLDAETERELMDVFRISSEDFIVPFRTQTTTSGEIVSYGVGLRNVFNNSDCTELNLSISPGNEKAVEFDDVDDNFNNCGGNEFPVGYKPHDDWNLICSGDVEIDGTNINDWIFAENNIFGPFEIQSNEIETFPVVFSLPEEDIPKGVYFFVLSVENDHDYCYTDVYKDVIIYIEIE